MKQKLKNVLICEVLAHVFFITGFFVFPIEVIGCFEALVQICAVTYLADN